MTSVVVLSAKGFSGWGVTPVHLNSVVYLIAVLDVKVAARDIH